MKVMIAGKALNCTKYYSEKTKKDVYALDVYDGRDLVRVNDVPPLYETVPFGEEITMQVRVGSNPNGMYFIYADKK